jgi:molecular chaperone DnaK
MTRMPAVQRAVSEFFEREPSKGVHPDEVVAVGAAVYGQMLQQNDGVSGAVPLHDVTAHSLGIMTAGGGFDALIPANTTVPVRVANVFSTSRDNQEQVKVVVLQGESERAKENDFLSQFALTGLRKAKAGEVEVEVVFEIDNDGIFRVAAIDRETGIAQTIDVLAQSGLEEDEIQRMMQDAQQHMAERRVFEEQEKHRQGIDVLLADLDKLLPQAEQKVSGTPVAAAAIIKARKAVDQVRTQVTAGNREKLGENLATLEKLSGMLKQVLSRS